MANDKTPKPDDFGAPVKPVPDAEARTVAEMSVEMEALRRQIAQLSAKPAEGHIQVGDPNETYAGEIEDADGNMVPHYFYRIDLAPCGGTDIRLSGETFFHGEVYKVSVHQLRTLREIVNRTWGHEAQINGTNENFYRKPLNKQLRGSR